MPVEVLVTGAAGHLGSAVCSKLVEDGFGVRAADLNYRGDLPVKVRVADLRDPLVAYDLIEGCQAVVHLANHPNPHGGPSAQLLYAENVAMNMNVFQAASELGIKKLVYSSSVQAFSNTREHWDDREGRASCLQYLPLDGAVPPCPGNTYALSKEAGENQLRYFARLDPEMSCTAIRFPALIGEHQFRWWHRRGRGGGTPWWLHGHADEGFSYLAVEDASSLISAVLQKMPPGYHQIFPAAPRSYPGYTMEQLVSTYFPNVPLRVPAEQMECLVDISEIKELLGWEPQKTHLFEDESDG